MRKEEKGITLIALVVTIVVLLILAGVSISMLTGENGIIEQANRAKIETAIGAVKEAINLEQVERSFKGETLTPETLLAEGKAKRTVQQGEDGKYYMYYALNEGAYEVMEGMGKGNLASLKDVFLIDEELNVKYIASNGKEYGDNLNNKILEDETEVRFSSRTFEEYVKKISGVTDEVARFKWMKDQTTLVIEDSSIDSLQDLVFFPNLTTLTIGGWDKNICPINKTMDGIENCQKLTTLNVYYGNDKDYTAISSLSNLTTFVRVGGNDYENIVQNLKNCSNLISFTLTFPTVDIDLKIISELKNLTTLSIYTGGTKISNMKYIKNISNLRTLTLKSGYIEEIEGLEDMTNLKTLDLSNNQITDITPLSANTSLTSLNLKGNSGIDGNRANYTGEKLEALNKIGEILDRNGTINIDVDKLGLFTNYKSLDLSGQGLENLDYLEGMTQLEILNLYSNNLTLESEKDKEILKSMVNLKQLTLWNNKNIEDISFVNSLPNLTSLNIYGCDKIKLKQIQDKLSSITIACSTESFKSLSECDTGVITSLKLRRSGYNLDLETFPIYESFSKLEELYISYKPGIKDFSNISKLTTLKKLDLTSCDLNSKNKIDFSKLINLEELTISNNYINTTYLNDLVNKLKNNSNLKSLDLRNNSIIDATSLLQLNSSVKIYIDGNVNISQEQKNQLKSHFGTNIDL